MKSSAVFNVISCSSTRGQYGHSPQLKCCSFSPSSHCFWSIEKAGCVLSVTSCGSITLSLSHQCTILYLHKKVPCVCVLLCWFALSVLADGSSAQRLLQWTSRCLTPPVQPFLVLSCSLSKPASLWRSHNQSSVHLKRTVKWLCHYFILALQRTENILSPILEQWSNCYFNQKHLLLVLLLQHFFTSANRDSSC